MVAGTTLGAGASRGAKNADRSPASWEAIRQQFAIDYGWMQFAGFLLASHPRPVRDALALYRAELDRNPALVIEDRWMEIEADVRARAAAFVGGAPDEIALTDSTTMGLGTLYGGIKLRPGQQLLTTAHDHYSTHESLRLRALRDGARLGKVKLFADSASATVDEIVGNLLKAVGDRTRVVAITWVHSSTGLKLPVRAIADALAQKNRDRDPGDRALLCVDGVHGFGVETDQPGALGCDFFVAGCHKWLCGPRGTGLIWGKRDAWPEVIPTIPAFEAPSYQAWIEGREHALTPSGRLMSPGGFHSFEHRWALPAAFAWQTRIGRERIKARIHALSRTLKEGLAGMRHVRLHTPTSSELSSGIVCFDVKGMEPAEFVKRMRARRIVASQTPYRVSYPRLAPSLLTSEQDVERVLAAVRELA
jgi:selenocysteine lyase/cysteine desulfurase